MEIQSRSSDRHYLCSCQPSLRELWEVVPELSLNSYKNSIICSYARGDGANYHPALCFKPMV